MLCHGGWCCCHLVAYIYILAMLLQEVIAMRPIHIKIEVDVTDKSPFFIRPFHANDEKIK